MGMRGMMGDEPPKKFSWAEQKKLIGQFASYYPRHRKLLAVDLLFVFLSSIAVTVIPKLVYDALQTYLPGKNYRLLVWTLAAMFFLTLFNILSEYVRTRWGHTLGVRMEADMRLDLFTHLQKLSFGYFDRTKTGHIMSRISN